MPRFNLDDYETVEARIARFYADNPDGRIITHEVTSEDDRDRKYWTVRAMVYLDHEDQHANCPKASGWAFEIEGTAGANQTAALENAETSAIGRALANAGYSGNKRTTREEMLKPARAENPVPDDVIQSIENAPNVDDLKKIWQTCVDNGWSDHVIKIVNARKAVLENGKKG